MFILRSEWSWNVRIVIEIDLNERSCQRKLEAKWKTTGIMTKVLTLGVLKVHLNGVFCFCFVLFLFFFQFCVFFSLIFVGFSLVSLPFFGFFFDSCLCFCFFMFFCNFFSVFFRFFFDFFLLFVQFFFLFFINFWYFFFDFFFSVRERNDTRTACSRNFRKLLQKDWNVNWSIKQYHRNDAKMFFFQNPRFKSLKTSCLWETDKGFQAAKQKSDTHNSHTKKLPFPTTQIKS